MYTYIQLILSEKMVLNVYDPYKILVPISNLYYLKKWFLMFSIPIRF
jgi:hypothetical protein